MKGLDLSQAQESWHIIFKYTFNVTEKQFLWTAMLSPNPHSTK